MKKNCNGCKAWIPGNLHVGPKCSLNYKLEVSKRVFDVDVESKPLEDCPKPLTNRKLVEFSLKK